MSNRLFALALLLIVARLLYWKRPPPPMRGAYDMKVVVLPSPEETDERVKVSA